MVSKQHKYALVFIATSLAEIALRLLQPQIALYSPVYTISISLNCALGLVSLAVVSPALEATLLALDLLNDVVYCYQEIFDTTLSRSTVERRGELRYRRRLRTSRGGVYV